MGGRIHIAQGAMPVVYADEVAAGPSEWFSDTKRAADLANGFFQICQQVGMALGAGESPALKYLINSLPPVASAPSLSGSITAIMAPGERLISGKNLRAGNRIIGVTSSGLHSNGISLIIRRTMGDLDKGIKPLKDAFMTRLPNGNTLGEEALIPTRSYVAFVEALLDAEVEIHALLPGTGDRCGQARFRQAAVHVPDSHVDTGDPAAVSLYAGTGRDARGLPQDLQLGHRLLRVCVGTRGGTDDSTRHCGGL